VQRLTQAYLAAGAPQIPDGYDLRAENRLDVKAFRAEYGERYRTTGKCCGGVEWMYESTANGVRHFLNGKPAGTSRQIERADGSFETRFDAPYGQSRYCEIYRNPPGSNETLDAYFTVCSHGVFSFGAFPLPP